ncbi:MAG TPA: 4-hydroxy-tetrahydrodipicolinate synthase [Pseudomonadales bacterium]|jgi:4-hydroxy-tetrahydrodipicolinate synthase|nr:4-hydroxy-tetrahydrodipicolinate synthase [Gammaproteobacteria bacterium]MDP6027115.1 4-hydroxy-tetrahydrodipicolinate synthase [Pseudomonadales bacterium]MDP7313430.1 4-hydroxy-tetrahydrodipicolinate synthase [Pseudomonadales bacterium]MDP7576459.1 4-hydroxy-tetrahydrodipicolinate synthase [Pseudomonadales bacterium]HJL61360.1 4-hydroxy-tetrahydrodipicolinate synthase [Pseudomonadales bacterium]|tara:strand:+ start:1154 stop:2032 length:879 start_codon:yes stop_codon:yes gene_type:complete
MISGSIVALVTPMNLDGSVDWDRLGELIEWHIEMGTDGLVPVGTTGESATVDIPEHCEIVKYVVNAVNGRLPVIAGTGGNATAEAIALTQAAKEAGADACLLVTPYYNKPTQEGLFQHYKAIAEAVDLPQVLYNVPARTACDMLPTTVARCAEIEQVVAIKEATGDLQRTIEILELCGPDMVIYSGDDATAVDLMLNGASGTISVTANVAPKEMGEVCRAAVSGDAELANSLNERLTALHRDLFLESNPIPVKWALAEMGKIGRGIRLPLTELSPEYQGDVRQAMRQAGVIN